MLLQQLQTVVAEKKRAGISAAVIKNILKEILQWYVLDCIYNTAFGKSLIFTGGSALRICYGLNRLSEDLDFDLEPGKTINRKKLAEELLAYFKRSLMFEKIEYVLKGKNKKIYLKFPILYDLDLARFPESDKLYVKVEIEGNNSPYGETDLVPISQLNLNFLIKSYTLASLCANKIVAVLQRTYQKGKNQAANFKGRDYYDLLWLFQKNVAPDKARLHDLLKIKDEHKIRQELLNKIESIHPRYLREDLLPLFEDSRFIDSYVKNYKEMIRRYLPER